VAFKDGSTFTANAIYSSFGFEQKCNLLEKLNPELTEKGLI